MIQLRAPSSGEMWEFIRMTIHYGFRHHYKWLSPQIVGDTFQISDTALKLIQVFLVHVGRIVALQEQVWTSLI